MATQVKQYKEQQAIINSMNEIQPSGYVFTNRAGNWIDPRDFQRDFKQTLKRCGIREINVHGLRHTFATRSMESGMSPKALSKILGHANVGFTLDNYAHVTEELMTDEMANLQGFL